MSEKKRRNWKMPKKIKVFRFRGAWLNVVTIKAKTLQALDSALARAMYRSLSKTKVLGFEVHGFFRKRYYAIVTGVQNDLEALVNYASRNKDVEVFHSEMASGLVYDTSTGEFKKREE